VSTSEISLLPQGYTSMRNGYAIGFLSVLGASFIQYWFTGTWPSLVPFLLMVALPLPITFVARLVEQEHRLQWLRNLFLPDPKSLPAIEEIHDYAKTPQLKEFHDALLKEYETMHKQIAATMKAVSTTETWTIAGIAAVWAFLLKPDKGASLPYPVFAWAIPFLLAIAGSLKVLGLYYDYGIQSKYIRDILEPKAQLRWEKYTFGGNHLMGQGAYPYILWLGLLSVTLWAWWWGSHVPPQPH
jgi:hypothetical protein